MAADEWTSKLRRNGYFSKQIAASRCHNPAVRPDSTTPQLIGIPQKLRRNRAFAHPYVSSPLADCAFTGLKDYEDGN